MEKITRTLTVTTIQFSEAIVESGIPTFRACASEVVPGEYNDTAKALQYLQKKYGGHRSFLITGMSTHTRKYEMDLATFIANATAVAGGKGSGQEDEPQETGADGDMMCQAPENDAPPDAPAPAVEMINQTSVGQPVQAPAPAPAAPETPAAPPAPAAPVIPATPAPNMGQPAVQQGGADGVYPPPTVQQGGYPG